MSTPVVLSNADLQKLGIGTSPKHEPTAAVRPSRNYPDVDTLSQDLATQEIVADFYAVIAVMAWNYPRTRPQIVRDAKISQRRVSVILHHLRYAITTYWERRQKVYVLADYTTEELRQGMVWSVTHTPKQKDWRRDAAVIRM